MSQNSQHTRTGSDACETWNVRSAVHYECNDGVAHVRLDRPHRHNAVDLDLARGLTQGLHAAERDAKARAVLVSGGGKSFCVGGDLREMVGAADPVALVKELARVSNRVVGQLLELDKPVVVAAHGNVAGAGLGYVCAADLVVAAETTTFVSAFTAVGLSPDSGVSWLLPRVVGVRRAAELTLTNRRLTAQEALEWGLVTTVRPDDQTLSAALESAQRLAEGAAATGHTRRLLNDGWLRDWTEQLAAEVESIAKLAGTPRAAELIAAFTARQATPASLREEAP